MKKVLFLAAALVLCASAFTSCSKDDVAPTITEGTQGAQIMSLKVKQGHASTLAPNYSNVDDNTSYTWTDRNGKVLGTSSTLVIANKERGDFDYTITAKNSAGSTSFTYYVTVEKDLITVDFEGDSWTKLIDSPQNNGPLLYGDGSYSWTDATTTLSSKLTNTYSDGKFWGGGIAISNYVDADIKNHNTYEYQLAVPQAPKSGKNFAVVYCQASMTFADGKARCLESIDICPTTYCLGVCTYGNSSAKALTTSDNLTLHIIGLMPDGSEEELVGLELVGSTGMVNSWTTIRGILNSKYKTTIDEIKVLGFKFTMTGSDNGDYGLNTPTYFAFDNVVINNYTE